MPEEWRPVVGWEGLYEVSSHGRVKSLPRPRKTPSGGEWEQPEKVLAVSVSDRGYSRITFTLDGMPHYFSVHRLVCEAFNGPPNDGGWALHRDGDPTNNRSDNLYWGTPSDNAQDTIRHGRNRRFNATSCPRGHEYTESNTYMRPDGKGRDCRECRSEANKRSKAERLELTEYSEEHGTLNGYTRYDCRCEKCREAYRKYRREKKTGVPPKTVGHGNLNAYNRYGCRCGLCTEAMSKYYRERRVKREQSET